MTGMDRAGKGLQSRPSNLRSGDPPPPWSDECFCPAMASDRIVRRAAIQEFRGACSKLGRPPFGF